jgi:hypothetical protein
VCIRRSGSMSHDQVLDKSPLFSIAPWPP